MTTSNSGHTLWFVSKSFPSQTGRAKAGPYSWSLQLSIKSFLPGMHWWHFIEFGAGGYVDEDGLVAGKGLAESRNELVWMCDANAAYAIGFGDSSGVHLAGEVNAEIALAVVETLQHFDPTKAAIVEKDQGDRQVQAGDSCQFSAGHAKGAVTNKANNAL